MSDGSDALRLLLIEDNPGDARLIEHHLRQQRVERLDDPELTHVESLTVGIAQLESEPFDLVLLDLGLPESSGIETLRRLLSADPDLPVVVLTGLKDGQTSVEAIKQGAQDYLPKDDLDAETLERSLRYAIERYKGEQELKRQNERLDEFASVISHDLRNPLNVAQGRLDLARMDCDSEHLDHAETALDRMGRIIGDVLELARQGRLVFEPERVDLAAVARAAWQNVSSDDATLVVEADGSVDADESRLQELFENVYRNAIQHAGPSVTITVTREDSRGFVVEDDGPGIDPESREDVFEPGYTTDTGGTGFGLSIVKQIAEAHGWEPSVEESPSGGARFVFSSARFE